MTQPDRVLRRSAPRVPGCQGSVKGDEQSLTTQNVAGLLRICARYRALV